MISDTEILQLVKDRIYTRLAELSRAEYDITQKSKQETEVTTYLFYTKNLERIKFARLAIQDIADLIEEQAEKEAMNGL